VPEGGSGGSLFEELKRRKVVRAILAWAGFTVVVKEGLEIGGPVFNMSPALVRIILFLVLLSLPAFIFFAWAFEVTPEGIKRTEELDDEAEAEGSRALARRRRAQRSGPRWLASSAMVVVAVLVGLYLVDPGGIVTHAREPVLRLLWTGVHASRAGGPMVEGGLEVASAITVEFTGPVDPATATSRTIQLLDSAGSAVPAEVRAGDTPSQIIVDPQGALSYGTTYTLILSEALKGADGRPVWGPERRGPGGRFTLVTQPVPAGGARPSVALAGGFKADRAPPRGPIPLRFSEAVDPLTAEAGIRLVTSTGSDVATALLFTDGNREVRVEPEATLRRGGRYVVVVDSIVTSTTGRAALADSLRVRVAPPAPRAAPAEPARTEPTPTRSAAPAPAQAARKPGPDVQAAPTGPATLNLTIVPEAALEFVKVVVDGDTMAAPVRGLSLEEGRSHSVVVVGIPELSAYTLQVFRTSVPVEPGQTLDLTAQLTPFGSVDVVSQPPGTVYIDGRRVGKTPLAGYPVTAGAIHKLEIMPLPDDAAAYAPFTAEFRVKPLEWKSLGRLSLPPMGLPRLSRGAGARTSPMSAPMNHDALLLRPHP